MNAIKRNFNADETLFDLMIIIILFGMYYLLNITPLNALQGLGGDICFFFVILIQYVMSFQLIRFFRIFKEDSEWPFIFALVVLSVIIYGGMVILPVMSMVQLKLMPGYFISASVLPGMFIVYFNAAAAIRDDTSKTGELWRSVFMPVILISYVIIKIAEGLVFSGVAGEGLKGTITLLILPLQLFALFPFIMKHSERIEAWYQKHVRPRFAGIENITGDPANKQILISGLTAVTFSLYQPMILAARPEFITFGHSVTAQTLSLMFFSGFIPFRLLWAFVPPRRYTGLFGALVMFGIYIYTILNA